MIKVLLIDDEPIIRQGLAMIIDWSKYGFAICGEAANGIQGLEMIETKKPDLVIVDIKMPVMDGLMMLEKLKRQKKEVRVIILTGYPEFDYAQKAIEFGVNAYILKPINENKLIEELVKVSMELSSSREIKKNLIESFQYSREKIIEELIQGHLNIESIDRANLLGVLDFPWNSYQLVLIKCENDQMDRKEYTHQVRHLVEEYTHKNNYGYTFSLDGMVGILLKDVIFTSSSHTLTPLKNNIKKSTNIEVLIAVGQIVKELEEVSSSYTSVCQLLEKSFLYGRKDIITSDALEQDSILSEYSAEEVLSEQELMNGLYMAIDVNSMDRINDLLEVRLLSLRRLGTSERNIKASYIDLYVKLANRILLKNGDLIDMLNQNDDFIGEVYNQKTLIELNAYVKFKLITISEELNKRRPDSLMIKIMDYLNRNYANDIKLDAMAQCFNYNSAYLGQLFKSHTGEYFNTYLDKVRIEKAKQFIDEGLRVYQVAERVGFSDKDYFVSKFKKYTGISPTTFKGRK